jgi:hypothetical protein
MITSNTKLTTDAEMLVFVMSKHVPQFLTRLAFKDLQEIVDGVEHNVDAEQDMACPPKRVTMAAGYEGFGPLEEDTNFQTHDHVPVDCGASVHVLDALSTRRGDLLCSETYIRSIEHRSQ